MVEPLSVVTTILTVVQLIAKAALTARQNKKCLELAGRARNLGDALPNFAKAAANDAAMVHGLERLHDALSEALKLIESCKAAGIMSGFSILGKAADLDNVDRTINNCLSDLNFFSLARSHAMSTHNVAAAGSVPAQTHVDYSSYYQAHGGACTAHVAWTTPPPPHHASQGYYHQSPGYVQGYYPASPGPSGSNLSTFYTLPTVNKIFKHVFR